MKEGLIALNYECSKCNERMGLYERKSAVLDGDFEWVCSTITSQNIYGRTPMILLTMRPSRLFVKIRCHAVASTRKRSAVRNYFGVVCNLEIATRKKHHPSRIFCDDIVNSRKLVVCVKRKAMAGQASRKKQWSGRGRVLFEVYESYHL
ncbi:hypothetical protein TNCV_3831211 [Trichonephila clavipes]|nr:hypothetical protein TNCV_3831211 [Trichonephila clavipes]